MIRAVLKTVVSKNSNAFRFLFRWYDWRFWFPKFWLPTRWHFNVLRGYADYKTLVKFIQVGSNDGLCNDPLREYILRYHWSGILVEPVPYLFERLKANYAGKNGTLFFENSAIASSIDPMPFYYLKESNLPHLPEWYNQLGSFNKDVVLQHQHLIPHFDELLTEDAVQTISFRGLLAKHHMENVELVHIDAEGYDYEILKLIPFEKLDLELIMFEHKHLPEADYKRAIRLLRAQGFIVGMTDHDTIALKKGLLSKLPVSKN
jgi:FkbM family methyltransferase